MNRDQDILRIWNNLEPDVQDSLLPVIGEIARQRKEYGAKLDDKHSVNDWVAKTTQYISRSTSAQDVDFLDEDKIRAVGKNFKIGAALCVSAMASYLRRLHDIQKEETAVDEAFTETNEPVMAG